MLLYLSGPMTGYPEWNYPLFRAEAARLRALGHGVLSPAENFGGATDRTREEYMRADIRMVLDAHAIALLPGWALSKGARLEVAIAREIGIPLLWAASLEPLTNVESE